MSPKEYTQCVASYVKKGVATDVAKGRCAAAYYKKHKMTVKQAHAKGIEEGPMSAEEVVLKEIDTYARKRELVRQALRIRYGYPGSDGGAPYSGPYVADISDTQVVVEWKGRLFEVLYEIDSQQEVSLGEMRELQKAYITAEMIALVREAVSEEWVPAGAATESLRDDGWPQGWRTNVPATLFNSDELVVEETEDAKGPFTIIGTALIDNAVSQNSRYYPAAFNDVAMKATNKFMKEGGIVTIYSRHARALPKAPGQFGLPDGLPVGKVSVPLWREGTRIKYKAIVVETTEGRDVQELIRKNVMPGTSIRAVQRYRSRMGKVDGRVLEVMEWAVIEGIDLTDNPGITGAGIESFLEEASQVVSITAEEVMDMSELEGLTLEVLREQRPDLLEAVVGPLTTQIADLKAAATPPEDPGEGEPPTETETPGEVPPAVDPKIEEVQGQLVVAGDRITELEFELLLQEAGQQDVGKLIVEELRKAATSADEIAAKLPEIRTQAIKAFLETALPSRAATEETTVGGKTGGALEGTPVSTKLSANQAEIVGYSK